MAVLFATLTLASEGPHAHDLGRVNIAVSRVEAMADSAPSTPHAHDFAHLGRQRAVPAEDNCALCDWSSTGRIHIAPPAPPVLRVATLGIPCPAVLVSLATGAAPSPSGRAPPSATL